MADNTNDSAWMWKLAGIAFVGWFGYQMGWDDGRSEGYRKGVQKGQVRTEYRYINSGCSKKCDDYCYDDWLIRDPEGICAPWIN